jgi:hypothetical protein
MVQSAALHVSAYVMDLASSVAHAVHCQVSHGTKSVDRHSQDGPERVLRALSTTHDWLARDTTL